jgi:hypothetical protein
MAEFLLFTETKWTAAAQVGLISTVSVGLEKRASLIGCYCSFNTFTLLIIEYSNGRFTEMEHITGQQIRYHWSRLQSEQYKRNEDPFLSSKLLTEEFGCVVLLHLSQPVVAFAFLMPDFQNILDASVENAEYFVDGTCEYYATIKYLEYFYLVEQRLYEQCLQLKEQNIV